MKTKTTKYYEIKKHRDKTDVNRILKNTFVRCNVCKEPYYPNQQNKYTIEWCSYRCASGG